MRDMEIFSKHLDCSDESALFSMVDDLNLSGLPLAKTAAHMAPKKYHFSKYILFFGALAILAFSLICFVFGIEVGEYENAPTGEALTEEDQLYRRKMSMFSMVLSWGRTPREILEDPASAPARALDWLIHDAQNPENDETMTRTRFALAALYFGTQNKSNGNSWVDDRYWLSSNPICLWQGVECLDDQQHSATVVKALNLSANGLTGTVPNEIGLLGEDILLLDISKNEIRGTVPEELFLMKNLGGSECTLYSRNWRSYFADLSFINS